MQTGKRLESLDALRGFDMFFIMGFAALVAAICEQFPGSGFAAWLGSQMDHVPWDGFHHHDSIFPLFLFIAGCSFPFSYASQVSRGSTRRQIFLRALKRCLILVFFGLAVNGFFRLDFANLRWFSVLGRIGLAWFGAAVMYIYLSRGWRIGICAAILIGYTLLCCLVGAPDFPGADLTTQEGSIVCWIDRTLFPHHIYQPLYDPEGLLSTLPAVVTACLGMFTGELLRSTEVSDKKKCLYMLAGGAAFVVLGLLWNKVQPINKALWSSSFVCLLAGYSLLNLVLFYWLIDVKGHRKWAFFFKVIGMNSITIYMINHMVHLYEVSDFFLKGAAGLIPEAWSWPFLQAGYLAVQWLFLYFLYKKKVFLKV